MQAHHLIPLNYIYDSLVSNLLFTKSFTSNNFQNVNVINSDNAQNKKLFNNIFYLISFILTCYALYLSFKCNQGFHLGSVLAALIFTPIYLIYRLTVPCIINDKIK